MSIPPACAIAALFPPALEIAEPLHLLAVVAFDPPCLLGRQLVLPAAGATGAEEALAVDRALDEALLRLQLLKLLEGRELEQIGRAHVGTPGTNAQLVYRLRLENKNY